MFSGDLPPFPEAIVKGVVASLPIVFRGAPPAALQQFRHGLTLALKARIAADTLEA
jgi:hypothetical protein